MPVGLAADVVRGIGRPSLRVVSTPAGFALVAGAAPQAKEMVQNLQNRYDTTLQDLMNAPYVEPGEKVVTASAQPFLEKRAALQQGHEKTARRPPNMGKVMGAVDDIKKMVEGLQKAQPSRAGKFLDKIISPTGLMIGGPLIGLGLLAEPSLKQMGKRIQKSLFPRTLGERAEMDEQFAGSYAKETGKQLAIKSVGLLGDIVSKAIEGPMSLAQNKTRKSIFNALQKEDDVLSQASPIQLADAYHTMARFAPTLATDKNAVKTFLRESVLYGTGPNVPAIKQLAEAEHAINPPPIKR
jgi:hypothetical protein